MFILKSNVAGRWPVACFLRFIVFIEFVIFVVLHGFVYKDKSAEKLNPKIATSPRRTFFLMNGHELRIEKKYCTKTTKQTGILNIFFQSSPLDQKDYEISSLTERKKIICRIVEW